MRQDHAFDDTLATAAGYLLVGGAVWLVVLVGAAALERCSHGRLGALAAVGCPASWRPVVLVLVGTALAVVGVSGPASARPTAPPPTGPLLPVPARVVDGAARPTPGPSTSLRAVVVRPGDSLWAIATRALPPGADSSRVARLVRTVHAENQAVIGDDPDLIHPGQRLLVPTEEHHR